MLPERFTRKILIGATDEHIVVVELEIGDDYNRPEGQHLSLSGEEYPREFFTEEEGEERAEEYLRDGELWKDAVANDRTTDGLEAWAENVIAVDGWQETLGNIIEVGDLYTEEGSAGQIDMHRKPEDFVKLAVSKEDVKYIWHIWKEAHGKSLKSLNRQAVAMIRAVFEKYPVFYNDQMIPYSNQAVDSEKDEEPEERENPIGPFTATWPSEPSHESSPAPPMSIPTEWWDEDGRVIEAKHEEEFVDLLIDKFWRRDILNDEVVETNGAFWGEHNTEQGYEWAGWRGEYRLGIIQYGDSASGPVAALRLSLRINAIDIASRIVTIERIDDKLVPIDRLFIRQSHEAVAKGGQYFASKADEMPLAIAIDKTHFLLRKLILRGAKMYPILEWVEVSTMTKGGVDPKMELVAIHPDGSRFLSYKPIDIPGSNFYYDDMIEKGYGLYINLEGAPSTASATPALDHLGHGARMNKELDRIFISDIQVDVEELPIEPTAIAGIQERVDSIEREIRMLRAKEKDFDSSNSAVAARLGKQDEYDKLMRERDEQMWRGNPGERRVVTKEDMRKRAELPKLLYHGTSIQNMHKVLREGLLVHQPQSAYTVESQHEEDTNLNVSLANTVQDAVFFSLGSAGWGADQAIIEFDTTKMTEEEYPAILRRPLFGKTGRFEYKVYTMRGIPPEHISRVLIRSFSKPGGRLEVTEKWYTREEALSLPR